MRNVFLNIRPLHAVQLTRMCNLLRKALAEQAQATKNVEIVLKRAQKLEKHIDKLYREEIGVNLKRKARS